MAATTSTSAKKAAAVNERAPASVEERIVEGAYHCFDRYGVAKTTIEDIAKAAGVSRPTVYKHFTGKEAIIDRISIIESRKINIELRRQLTRQDSFAANLTEAMLVIVRIATHNKYVRRISENIAYSSHATARHSEIHTQLRELWGGMLSRAIEEGQVAKDLNVDDVVTWLTSAQQLLLAKVDAVPVEDAELRKFIRRFVVEQLLPERAP